MLSVSVFLGPSLSLCEARELLPSAKYLGPAAQGDLVRTATADRAEIVVLIDGTFHHSLSVWHNEICYLLAQGIRIIGASSMGALRAAETERYGMRGVGQVFEWYRDNVITADDEVALVHADASNGYLGRSFPMVNIRATLAAAQARGEMDAFQVEAILTVCGSMYYPDRELDLIVHSLSEAGITPEVRALFSQIMTDRYVDQKRQDAIDCLSLVRRIQEGREGVPPRIDFTFSRSASFDTLYNLDRVIDAAGYTVPLQAVSEYVALHDPEFGENRQAGLHRDAALFLAILLGYRVREAEVDAERETFLRKRGLNDAVALDKWCERNSISREDLAELVLQEALLRRVRRWALLSRSFDRGSKSLLDVMRLRGTYAKWAELACDAQRVFDAFGDTRPYRGVAELPAAALAAMHASNGGNEITGDAGMWAEYAGFEDVGTLAQAVRNAVIVHDAAGRAAALIDQDWPESAEARPESKDPVS